MVLNRLIFQFFSIVNFFLSIFLIFLFLFFGYKEIAAEGFVTISIINIFTYGFSGNARNIYLGAGKILSLRKIIFFRLLVSIIAALITSVVIYFFLSKDYFFYLYSIVIITISSFIFELFIARTEKKELVNKYHAFNILFFLIFSILIFYKNLLDYLLIYVLIYFFFNFFIFKIFFKSLFITKFNFVINLKNNINLGVLSSLIKTISNFIWRYSALILLGGPKSSILFMSFSLASFFGTLFDISYGASFLKKIKSVRFLLNIMFLLYSILVYLFIYFFTKYSLLSNTEYIFLLKSTFFSLFGSFIIIEALRLRQKYFEIPYMHKLCFGSDILIYFFNSFLITLLYFINEKFVILAYLIASIFFYFVYKVIVEHDYKKKSSK